MSVIGITSINITSRIAWKGVEINMHATYCFLMDFNKKDVTQAEIEAAFDDRYASHYCDENNWFQLEAIIFQNGKHLPLCDDGDWRGRSALQEQIEKEIDPSKRWAWGLHWAAEVVAVDMGLFGASNFSLGRKKTEIAAEKRLQTLPIEAIFKSINREIPQRLAKAYQAAKPIVPKMTKRGDHNGWLTDYRRAKLAQAFEKFRSACRHDGILPFTDALDHPYVDYRAYDLRQHGDQAKQIGILFVDIHT